MLIAPLTYQTGVPLEPGESERGGIIATADGVTQE